MCCSKSPDPGRGMSWASNTTLLDASWWSFLSFIQMWCIDPEHVSLEDPVCQIVLLLRCPVSPWSHYYSLNWASVRKQVKLYESLSFTIVRQHRFLASETSMWLPLMASTPQTGIFAMLQQIFFSRYMWCARGMSWASRTIILDTPGVSHKNLITIWH